MTTNTNKQLVDKTMHALETFFIHIVKPYKSI